MQIDFKNPENNAPEDERQDTEAYAVFSHYREYRELDEPRRFFNGNSFIPELMLYELMNEDNISILKLSVEKEIRLYRKGVYELDTGHLIEKMIMNKLDIRNHPTHLNNAMKLIHEKSLIKQDTSGLFPFQHPDYINLLNGYIDIRNGEFKEHHPEFKSLIQIPVIYDPNAECTEIDAFLQDKLKGRPDLITLVYELFGISMLQQIVFDNVFVLLGPSHTGKSTILHLLRNFLGGTNTSAVTLQQLNDESLRFARVGLYGKLANTSNDLSTRYFTQDSMVKAISQGDSIEVEAKNKGAFNMSPFATLIAACNEMPGSSDISDAWANRLTILPFDVAHKEVIPNILARLSTPQELSGLFNKAFTAMQNAMLRNGLTVPGEVKAAREEYRRQNNHMLDFFDDYYTRTDNIDDYILRDDMYDTYKTWCDDAGIKPLPKTTKFNKAIENITGHKVTRIPKQGPRGYRRVRERTIHDNTDDDDDNNIGF